MKPDPRDLVLWDVLEEHADEASRRRPPLTRALTIASCCPAPLALRLAIVTGGHAPLETRASARHQLAALQRLASA